MENEPNKRAGVCDRCIVEAIRNITPQQEIDPTKLTLKDIRDTIEYIRETEMTSQMNNLKWQTNK